MFRRFGLLVAALAASHAPSAGADATLVYETTLGSGSKVQHTISISGRWLRIDSDAEDAKGYTIMDTGRLLKFDIDDASKSFTVTRAGRLFWPSFSMPVFKATKQMREVADVRCRKVMEMRDGEPVAEHCMSASGPLNLSAREQITLTRLFTSARRMGMGWAGAATEDERQVSIASKLAESVAAQELKSVSHEVIPSEKLRIPPDYKRIGPDRPDYHPGKAKPAKHKDMPKTSEKAEGSPN